MPAPAGVAAGFGARCGWSGGLASGGGSSRWALGHFTRQYHGVLRGGYDVGLKRAELPPPTRGKSAASGGWSGGRSGVGPDGWGPGAQLRGPFWGHPMLLGARMLHASASHFVGACLPVRSGAVGPSSVHAYTAPCRPFPRFWCKLASLFAVCSACGPEGRKFESCWARQKKMRRLGRLRLGRFRLQSPRWRKVQPTRVKSQNRLGPPRGEQRWLRVSAAHSREIVPVSAPKAPAAEGPPRGAGAPIRRDRNDTADS